MILPILLQVISPSPVTNEATPSPVDNAKTTLAATTTELVGEEKVICRRRPVTGSFAKRTKVCHTRREWNRLDEDVRNDAGEYVDHGRGGTNNGG